MFHDREAKASASLFARTAFIYAVKAFKDPWKIVRRNATARIRHGNEDSAIRTGTRLNSRLAARFVEFHRVIQQIDERLFQT